MNGGVPRRWQRAAISAFAVFHVTALLWWNIGVVEYVPEERRRPADLWQRARGAVAAADPAGLVRSLLTEYVRATGLWQMWVLFGPDAPHETALLEILGITGVDDEGRPSIDPTPIWSVRQQDTLDHSQAIGLTCGWRDDDEPRWNYLRRAYAHFRTEEAERARNKRYERIQFVCHLREVRLPGDTSPESWRKVAFYDGPVDREWFAR
jgi:hypothetical protein